MHYGTSMQVCTVHYAACGLVDLCSPFNKVLFSPVCIFMYNYFPQILFKEPTGENRMQTQYSSSFSAI